MMEAWKSVMLNKQESKDRMQDRTSRKKTKKTTPWQVDVESRPGVITGGE